METQRNVEPWWKTRNVPWRGVLFQDMILKEDDPEEMRIQKIRKPMLKRYQDGKRRLSFHWATSVTLSYTVAFVNTSHLNIVHILFRHTFLRLQFGVVQAYNPSVNLHSWAYMRNSGI